MALGNPALVLDSHRVSFCVPVLNDLSVLQQDIQRATVSV